MNIDASMVPSEVAKELGRRLEQVRLARNLSQRQLAEKAGVSLSSVARLERGNATLKLEILLAVCAALALTANFEQLVPKIELTPLQLLKGEQLPKRARRRKLRAIKWGDEA